MRLKTIAAVAVLALSAGLVLAACGSDDDSSAGGGYGGDRTQTQAGAEETPPKPAVETIVVRDGAPVDGVAELEYDAGEEVRFRVRSNTADEVHVHGYDVTKEVPAGRPVTVTFPAELEGIYEAELHGSGEQIAEIRVNP